MCAPRGFRLKPGFSSSSNFLKSGEEVAVRQQLLASGTYCHLHNLNSEASVGGAFFCHLPVDKSTN